MNFPIQVILVPQGAEYKAVCQGLRQVANPPTVFPVPVGPVPLVQHLERLFQAGCLCKGQHILVLGLCGALIPDLAIGDAVLYQTCLSTNSSAPLPPCPPAPLLSHSLPAVTAITSDRVISTPAEKHQLAHQFAAQVVDMEGHAAIAFLTQIGAIVTTIRVISDDCHHPIPNLANAFSPAGTLKPIALTVAMLRQPIAAVRLVRGSLHGLAALQKLTHSLFC